MRLPISDGHWNGIISLRGYQGSPIKPDLSESSYTQSQSHANDSGNHLEVPLLSGELCV